MLSGIDGVLLVVVIGEGKLVVPVDFAIRRPDPQALGPCRDKLHWGCRSCSMDAWQHSADAASSCPRRWSWRIVGLAIRSSCAMWRRPTRTLVEGKSTYVFALPDGRQVKGVTCSSTAIGRGVE